MIEAKNIASQLENDSTYDLDSKKIELNFDWVHYPEGKLLGGHKIIFSTKELFDVDFPSSTNARKTLIGVNIDYKVVEISEDHKVVIINKIVNK